MFNCVVSVAVFFAACSSDAPTAPKSPADLIKNVTWTGFQFRTEALTAENCIASTESETGKISSGLQTAFQSNPNQVVIVSMKETVVNGPLPDSGQMRTDPTRDATWMSWVTATAASQRCAVDQVVSAGAMYQQSFVVGNSFVAQMSQSVASTLAARTDVRYLEPNTTCAPLP
jgi:hypothetical protein